VAQISAKVGQALDAIVGHTQKVDALVAEVAEASMEQEKSIEQINASVSQMNDIIHQNAAAAEESASAAEELNAQAETMNSAVSTLMQIVEGSTHSHSSKADKSVIAPHTTVSSTPPPATSLRCGRQINMGGFRRR
jgi:methyl-accepting chemotaxis protein